MFQYKRSQNVCILAGITLFILVYPICYAQNLPPREFMSSLVQQVPDEFLPIPAQLDVLNSTLGTSGLLPAKLTGSGYGYKELVWDPVYDWQTITYNVEFNLELKVSYRDSWYDVIRYNIMEVTGTIRFWGTAEDQYYETHNTWEFDKTHNVQFSDYLGNLEYSIDENRVVYAGFGLPTATDPGNLRVYYLRFFNFAKPATARVWVDLPNQWYFDDIYDCCKSPYRADFRYDTIIESHCQISHNSGFVANSGNDSWMLNALGGYFEAEFEADAVFPGLQNLVLQHLTSANAGCPGSGYSPIEIKVNGSVLEASYDPAANNQGNHSFVMDKWNIGPYLQVGSNAVCITLTDQACSPYWIRHFNVEALYLDCAECEFSPVELESVEAFEKSLIKTQPLTLIYHEDDNSSRPFKPIADCIRPSLVNGKGIKIRVNINSDLFALPEIKCMGEEVFTGLSHTFLIDTPPVVGQYKLNLDIYWIQDLLHEILLGSTSHDFYQYWASLFQPVMYLTGIPEEYLQMATELAEGATKEIEVLDNLNYGLADKAKELDWHYTNVYKSQWPPNHPFQAYATDSSDKEWHLKMLYENKKYGDCNKFRDAWIHLADLHGIITHPVTYTGRLQNGKSLGFLTIPTTSLTHDLFSEYDKPNAYEGSTPISDRDRYFFASHALAQYKTYFSQRYYDPTFTSSYLWKDFFVEDRVNQVLIAPPVIKSYTDRGYVIYDESSKVNVSNIDKFLTFLHEYWPPQSSQTAKQFSATLNSINLFSIVSASGDDINGDGIYETLQFNTQIDATSGIYRLGGVLSKDGTPITVRDRDRHSSASQTIIEFEKGGMKTAIVNFSGEDLFQSGLDGPYTATLYVEDANGILLDSQLFTTPAFSYTDFGEVPIRLTDCTDSAVDTDPNEGFEQLRVSLTVEVLESQEYEFLVSLSDPNVGDIAEGTVVVSLASGESIVDVNIDGKAIQASGIDGPYQLDVFIRDPNQFLSASGQCMTSPYEADMFRSPPVLFTGNFTDRGRAGDPNTLFEALEIEIALSVQQAGSYEFYGWLYDPNEHLIDTDIATVDLLPGTGTVTLSFEGYKISQHAADGPYTLGYIACRTPEPHSMLIHQIYVHQTGMYYPAQFEPGISSGLPGDISGNGLVNIIDLGILSEQWLQIPAIPSADIAPPPDGDGDVNMLDFVLLAENWMYKN